jgi:hypothetical protein
MMVYRLGKNFEKFEVGMDVQKISGKLFKSGKKVESILSFGINKTDPKKRRCAIFQDGSVCNLELLEISKN